MPIPTYDTLMRPILVRATKEPITRRSMTEAIRDDVSYLTHPPPHGGFALRASLRSV